MPAALKPYLTYSFLLHAAFALFALGLLGSAVSKKEPIYTIDFVGPSAGIIDMAKLGQSAKPAASAPTAAQTQAPAEDDFRSRLQGKHIALPKPSLMRGRQAPQPTMEEAPAGASDNATVATDPRPAPGGSTGLIADMPNFPYPWYLSEVRQALWSQWSAHMPSQAGSCVVSFTLLRNGSMTDLRVEVSAGDSAFDLAAMGAVRDAGPYPSLPSGFTEPFLKFHVTLKSG